MAWKFRSVVGLANRKLPIKWAAIILASSSLLSALLGIFRDRWLNTLYLDTYPSGIDAYTAAFMIPDFMFFILVSGALAVTFIPVFNQRLSTGNKKSAWELTSSLLNLLALVSLVATVLIMIFADPLIRYVVGPGLDEQAMVLSINMMRVISINLFLFSVATLLSSVQQAVGRFVFYAIAPALYNIGILIGIMWFTGGINIFGWQIFEGGIMGVAIGVVLGALMQVVVSFLGIVGLGFDYQFKINWKNQGLRSVLRLLPARSLDQGIDYVNSIVSVNLASRMGPGVVRAYYQATNLQYMPVTLIGIAISTAFFPKLTEDASEAGDEKFNDTLRVALRAIIWITMPVALVAYFARGYVVSFIKNGGDMLIASILGAFVVAIVCRSIFHIASRGFYARQDTKTPMIVSLVAIGLNIVMSIVFAMVFGWGPEGLAIAQSLGALIEIVILFAILQYRSRGKLLNRVFWSGVVKITIASVVCGVVTHLMVRMMPLMGTDDSFFLVFPKFCLIVGASLLSYLIAGWVMRLDEMSPITRKLKQIVFRNIE
jgi:putative peptidoglycan lipid II flippase